VLPDDGVVGDLEIWRCGDVEMWKCEDLKIWNFFFGKFAEHCRRNDVVEESIANIFPEGIQLGSIMISEDKFRIPEGMRPFPIPRLPCYDHIGAYLRHLVSYFRRLKSHLLANVVF